MVGFGLYSRLHERCTMNYARSSVHRLRGGHPAELVVIDEICNRRMIAADRTLRISPDLHLTEFERQGIEEDQAVDQRFPCAQDQLDRLERLQAPDDSAQHAKDSRLRATRHEPRRGRGGIQATVTPLPGEKDRHLPLETEDS